MDGAKGLNDSLCLIFSFKIFYHDFYLLVIFIHNPKKHNFNVHLLIPFRFTYRLKIQPNSTYIKYLSERNKNILTILNYQYY